MLPINLDPNISISSISIPFFGMMLLTLVVWVYMYIRRITWILKNNVATAELKTPEALNQIVPEVINRPANNLKNLFELPVLFYARLYLSIYISTSE